MGEGHRVSWQELALAIALGYNHAVLLYFFAINTQYLLLMLVGFRETRRALREMKWRDLRRLMRSPLTPPISVIAPAHNEEANIAQSVRSLLMLNYPEYEVIVVNDGSTDGTLSVLVERFGLRRVPRSFEYAVPCHPVRAVYESPEHPSLVVVDKENGGKADALNAGLNLALYPLFCAIDADSVLEDDALLRVVRPFVEEPEVTVATGGIIRIANGCDIRGGRIVSIRLPRRFLPLVQVVEYLRGFLFGRMGWSGINGLLIISGAFGLFDKRAAVLAGGYAHDTVGEDMELVVRMHRRLREAGHPYRVRFVPDPVCWTEAPETLEVLRRQRNRWHRGLIDTLWRHRAMFGRPRFGVVGLLSMPTSVVFEMLGPLVELTGYVAVPLCYFLGLLDTRFMLAFLAVSVLYGILLSVSAVLLEDMAFRRYPRARDLALLVLVGILENLGYRQVTAWWRARAFWDYWRGDLGWGRMERRGIAGTRAGRGPSP
jgi:cellulose synthase/poly-beta-1,6-N-acetylglucosamine synthase-like glycosyltransferase